MRRTTGVRVVTLAACFVAAATTARAQGPADQTAAKAAAEQVPVAAPAPQAPSPAISRWVDLQTVSLQFRYRHGETSAGVTTSNEPQDNVALKARLKFDPNGRYSANIGVATGTSFTGGWNSTGIGTGVGRVTSMYMKQLFLAAAPVKGVDASYGGLTVARGESTEITSYDNDGYITGERVSVKRPKQFYFDELSFTNGYLGDLTTPGFTDRYTHLDDVNYRQMLVGKKLAKWIGVSADVTRLSGVSTVRAAVNAKVPQARVIDTVRYEEYRRLGVAGAFGFSAYAERAVNKRLTAGAGFADIDAKYGGLNADRFNKGRRVFEQAAFKLTRDLQAQFFATQAIDNGYAVSNKTRVDVIVAYNALSALQHAGLFR